MPLTRSLTTKKVWIGLRLALALLLVACGASLLTDRYGLRAEYFALGAPWEGEPVCTAVGAPGLEDPSRVGEMLNTKAVFSIRWSGFWEISQEGEHRFFLDADDGGYLRIDDELIVDTSGALGEKREAGRKSLSKGFHTIEIGLHQTYGDSRLAVHWVPPGATDESAAHLPLRDLYSGRPLFLREIPRRTVSRWPQAYRQLVGALLLLAALSLLPGLVTTLRPRFAARFETGAAWLRTRLPPIDGRGIRIALLLGLFVLAMLAIFPFTGTVRGGDDTSYLDTATFNVKSWYVNRYAHVYLLKLFTTLSGGEPLVGVRVWWSFVFAATVTALAVAVKSIGPGLQLRTLAVTLFCLFAQPVVFGLIGAGFADYSAMMFVTVAVAVYLHGLASDREHSPPEHTPEHPPSRHEWHALAIGVLTVGAFRSKEVGAVLLLLPALFLIQHGPSLELRRLVRKLAYWAAGAAAVLLSLMILDGWILGDFFFTVDSNRLATTGNMNFPTHVAPRGSSWLDKVWHGQAMRSLWLGVAAGAIAAGVRRRRLELRLLHLLPIAYLVALIVLYIRLPHPFSDRMLIPILPVACLMAGLLLHYAGLDEVTWRELLHPGVVIPGGLAAAVVFLMVLPYRVGTMDAAGLLPGDYLRRYGWRPDHFVVGVLLPASVLLGLSGVALVASRRRVRVVALLVAYATLFSVGFETTRLSLAQNRAVQVGELLLYPWRTFRDELNAMSARAIALSSDLRWYYQMSATTGSSLARLVLGRQDVRIGLTQDLPENTDVAIVSHYAYRAWQTQIPALEETATFDPAGLLVLVRPKEATQRQRRLWTWPYPEHRQKTIEEVLDELRHDRDPEARDKQLRWILDTLYGPGRGKWLRLHHLDGVQLRAVALSGDGWTYGVRPAGLILHNRGPTPLTQQLKLGVGAKRRQYPFRVFVDDGETVETYRFDQAAPRHIELRPVPPRSSRLVLVWSERAWRPGGGDERELGVRILVPDRD